MLNMLVCHIITIQGKKRRGRWSIRGISFGCSMPLVWRSFGESGLDHLYVLALLLFVPRPLSFFETELLLWPSVEVFTSSSFLGLWNLATWILLPTGVFLYPWRTFHSFASSMPEAAWKHLVLSRETAAPSTVKDFYISEGNRRSLVSE